MKKYLILALVLLLAVFSFVSCDSDDDDDMPAMPSGTGTASDPYVIKSTEQFLNLNSSEIQNKIMAKGTKDLHFRLEADINLSGKSFSDEYAVKYISGEFDGNGHTITGSDSAKYIFKYAVDDTTFKNFTVDFDENNITKVFYEPMIIGEFEGTNFIYGQEKLNTTFDNVDYDPHLEDRYYALGDSNTYLYFGNPWVFLNDEKPEHEDCFYSKSKYEIVYKEATGAKVVWNTTLKDCDVDGKYTGGFSGSGSALYYGGQFEGGQTISVKKSDITGDGICEFEGLLVGTNVGLVVSNKSGCEKSGKTYSNSNAIIDDGCGFKLSGTITYFGNNSDVVYANGTGTDLVSFGSIDGSSNMKGSDKGITSINYTLGSEITFSLGEAENYEVKLTLPSVYWYIEASDTSYNKRTDSNIKTIVVNKTNVPKIYAADYVVSKYDKDNKVNGIDLTNATSLSSGTFREGESYEFLQTGDDNSKKIYLVIDYSSSKLCKDYTMSYVNKSKNNAFSSMKDVLILGINGSGEIVAVGKKNS